uniref:Serine/threonine-protein phosphatase 2A 55 kDa regulatory subunit B n=1 Tax=Dermatophagoides pteronyssinus TaxID=6956 RepID=A0A6P6XV70_DERPT|nr:serine/threonine-protein phosphatase 2A 55 kDa regulatory subunit B beta isoform-like [Dermatophagoides pteronyssinus]
MSRHSILSGIRNNNNNLSDSLNWSFVQVKGTLEDEFSDADLISCVEFNSTGQLLACGDKGGRIVIFQENERKKTTEYDLYSTFQSHEAEFDYLKSIEIEEKINKICWLDESKTAANHFMLTTNDKTIKLWKLSEKDKRIDDSLPNINRNYIGCDSNGTSEYDLLDQNELRIPKMMSTEPTIRSNLRRIFSNAHSFHINSVSINSDQETFISSDELRINLWNLDITNESFVIVDIKPSNMADLSEVISAAEFHPQHCNIFAYSTSKGSIKLCDMREAALCDHYSKIFRDTVKSSDNSNFFHELISVISDLKFTNSGRYMITRDYMTVNVWDLNMERNPIETYEVHEYLRGRLGTLYENEYIFDKFEFSLSGNDDYIMTGSYNFFKIIDRKTEQESLYEINKDIVKQKHLRPQKVAQPTDSFRRKTKKDEIIVDNIDLNRRIYHTAWNPNKNLIAVASTKNLFIFQS